MSNIQTAEDFFTDNKIIPFHTDSFHMKEIHKIMVDFAKIHVKEALEKAKKEYMFNEQNESDNPAFLADVILNSYPLTNIK